MSLIHSTRIGKLWLRNNAVLVTAVRNHWNKDYKPGPYPKTEEARLEAAKKYGIHPAEYEPYPDDGSGYGDYPKIPAESGDSRDPFYPWDHPAMKRNFNEPIHIDLDLMREDRYDVNAKFRIPAWMQWGQFLGVLFGCSIVYMLCEKIEMFHGVTPRQYPTDERKHLTFETD